MPFLIYKKPLNIDKQKVYKKRKQKTNAEMAEIPEIAEQITLEDKIEIQRHLTNISRDARGRLNYRRGDASNLLPYFQKYVDSNVKGNIFGCGGCVNKMLDTMLKIGKQWRNPTT